MTDKPRSVAALAKRRRTKQRDDEALLALHWAIVDDLNDGVTQAELVRLTGYTREHIRQLAKAAREGKLPPRP